MIELLLLILDERRQRFSPGNDKIWGEGNWIECAKCPDSYGFPSFHHRNAHAWQSSFPSFHRIHDAHVPKYNVQAKPQSKKAGCVSALFNPTQRKARKWLSKKTK